MKTKRIFKQIQNMAKKNKATQNEAPVEEPMVETPEAQTDGSNGEAPENESAKAEVESNEVPIEGVGGQGAEADTSTAEEELDEWGQVQAELKKAQQEAAEWKDKHVRLMAEFDNFRKRTRREAENFREYASEEMMKALLPVVDDFGRTMSALEKTDNLASLKEGVTLVSDKFWRILEKKGLQAMNAKGTDFDLDLHEVIHSLPVEDEAQKGKVLDVVESGYKLKDKVIRYAKVVVGE